MPFAEVVSAGVGSLLGGAGRAASYLSNMAIPNESIGFDGYTHLFNIGVITGEVFRDNITHLGHLVYNGDKSHFQIFQFGPNDTCDYQPKGSWNDFNTVSRHILYNKPLPSMPEIHQLYNRGLITEAAARVMLRSNSEGESALSAQLFKLKDQIPGPGDLVNFAVRDCFDPNIVTTFQYNKELPIAILPYMKAQGLAGNLDIAMPPGSTTTDGNDTRTKAQWFDLYWWSHWQLPSVGQGFEMIQRLYNDSTYGPNPEVNPQTYFTFDNLELLQKANDFPLFWRKRLQEIAYVPLQKRDVAKLYKYGELKDIPGDRSLFHAIKAHGYSDKNTLRLVNMVKQNDLLAQKRLSQGQLKELYEYGSITLDEYRNFLLGLDLKPTTVQYILHMSTIDINLKIFKEVIPLVKKAFVNGEMSLDEARATLTNFGIINRKTEQLLSVWQLDMKANHNLVGLSQSIGFYKAGLVSEKQLRDKLDRMRYRPEEKELIVTKAKQDMFLRQLTLLEKSAKQVAKEQEQLDKNNAKLLKEQSKQLETLAKTKQKAIATTDKERKSPYSEKNIIAFAKAHYLTAGQIVKVLTDKGWLLPDVYRWMLTYTPDVKGMPKDAEKQATPVA